MKEMVFVLSEDDSLRLRELLETLEETRREEREEKKREKKGRAGPRRRVIGWLLLALAGSMLAAAALWLVLQQNS